MGSKISEPLANHGETIPATDRTTRLQIHDEENEAPPSMGQPRIPLLAPARIFDGLADLCLGVAIRTAQLLELHIPSSYYGLNDGPEAASNAERRLRVWLCEYRGFHKVA